MRLPRHPPALCRTRDRRRRHSGKKRIPGAPAWATIGRKQGREQRRQLPRCPTARTKLALPVASHCPSLCQGRQGIDLARRAAFSNPRPAQAPASLAGPWDPRPGIRGDGAAAAANGESQTESPDKARATIQDSCAFLKGSKLPGCRSPHPSTLKDAEATRQPVARDLSPVLESLTRVKECPHHIREDHHVSQTHPRPRPNR
jgi:hypothetical protein